MSNGIAKLLQVGSWSILGAAAARGIGLIGSIYLARDIDITDYGRFGLLQSTVSVFGTFATAGIGLTATRFLAESEKHDTTTRGELIGLCLALSLSLGIVLGLALWYLSETIAHSVFHDSGLVRLLRLGAPLIAIAAISSAQSGVLMGLGAFKEAAMQSAISGVLGAIGIIGGCMAGEVHGAVIGLACGLTLQLMVANWSIARICKRDKIKILLRLSKEHIKTLRDFAVPSLGSSIAVAPIYWVCSSMIARQPNGLEEIARFNAANQWFIFLLFIPSAMSQSALAVVVESKKSLGSTGLRATTLMYVMINAAIVVVPMLAGIILQEEVMSMYGPRFSQETSSLVVCLITAALLAVQTPAANAIAAAGSMWTGAAMNAGWAIMFASFTWVLSHEGAPGLAFARLLAYIVHGTWTFAYIARLDCKIDNKK